MHVLMCEPLHFAVTETDAQNMHMDPDNPPNTERALRQHRNLVKLYRTLGISVSFIDPVHGLPDMSFTANCGITHPNPKQKHFLLSNFKPLRRCGEREHYFHFFRDLGYSALIVPPHLCFEGAGDVLYYKDSVLFGYGFRSDLRVYSYITSFTGQSVVPLKLQSPGEGRKNPYHLDTAVIPLPSAGKIIAFREGMTDESWRRLRDIATIIPASIEDAENLALNALVVPRHKLRMSPHLAKEYPVEAALLAQKRTPPYGVVITSNKASGTLKDMIMKAGYVPITIDVSEFLKSGAGVFCLTKVL